MALMMPCREFSSEGRDPIWSRLMAKRWWAQPTLHKRDGGHSRPYSVVECLFQFDHPLAGVLEPIGELGAADPSGQCNDGAAAHAGATMPSGCTTRNPAIDALRDNDRGGD